MNKCIVFFGLFLLMFSFLFVQEAKGKEPGLSSLRWGDDVRITEWDSVNVAVFDVDSSTGNLFAALNCTYGGTDVLRVYVSADTGRTWSEITAVGWDADDIDGVVFNDYFYVAHAYGSAVFMGRYSTIDGTADNSYGYRLVFNEGVSVREIALASTEDISSPKRLYCFGITDDDILRCYWADTAVTSWTMFDPGIDDASGGLDACCNEGYSSDYIWCSYVNTSNMVFAGSAGAAFTSYGPLDSDPITGKTSIAAYNDIIMVLYSYLGGDLYYSVRSCASYNGGLNWFPESSVFDSTITTGTYGASALTARKGEGFAAVSPSLDGCFYRHRGYPSGAWSSAELFSDRDANSSVKPAIERVAPNSYGIIYVDDSTGGAWFDISQWPEPGIEEKSPGQVLLSVTPSIFSSRISIEYILPMSQNISLDVYDILGSHVETLAQGTVSAGRNSAVWDGNSSSGESVSSGMYFCVLKTDVESKVIRISLIK